MIKKTLLGLTLLVSLSIQGQDEASITLETLSQSAIEEHIYFLASDELKGRETGSPEIDIAAEYLATTLRRFGVQPVPGAQEGYFQAVELETVQPAASKRLILGDFTTENVLVMSGSNMERSMEAVFVDHGLEKDYENKDVAGKLAVALVGKEGANDPNSSFGLAGSKRAIAKRKDAVGLIEINTFGAGIWYRFINYFGRASTQVKAEEAGDFIHLWLQDEDERLQTAAKKKKAIAEISVAGMSRTLMAAKNVVGMVEGTDPELKNEFVIYSAHYDHIGIGQPNAEGDSIYNGARDNAVGVVTVLSAAESIAKNPTKRSALFILFTAEEKGLLGSKWYAEHPLIPMNQMVYCFNSDNGGYNDTSVATIIGLERTTVADHIKAACKEFDLEAIDDPAPEQGLFDRSDNVSFASKGVPAPTFSLGFRAFDAEIGKYYHQASDNPDNLDYEYLTKFFGAYVMACRLIANDPITPFWVEGDKYHAAGKALYSGK
ncbi:MAG: M28 family peptidase [Bacteroidota bacterium]